jgi:thiamine transport system permease protein
VRRRACLDLALRGFCSVELRLIAPALTSAALFAFTVSLGDYGAALLLSRPDFPTIPVVIARFLGQPGAANYGQALALSTILMLISISAFLVIEQRNTS